MSDNLTFTEPTLCHYNHDLSRSWFVHFDCTSELIGKKVRRQFRGDINQYTTKKERLLEGNAMIAFWKEEIRMGRYNPFLAPGDIPRPVVIPKTVAEAVAMIISLKGTSCKERTISKYNEVASCFTSWLIKSGMEGIRLYQFNRSIAQGYLDYLILTKRYSGKSHNNHLNVLKSIFAAIHGRWEEILTKHPFKGISQLPEQGGNNLAYTDTERGEIIDYLKEHDRRMYYAVSFLFHGFIRKTELSLLKVGDIDFENKTIRVNAGAAKNRTQESVTITEGLLAVIKEMGLDMAPANFYIFGHQLQTVAKKISKADIISDRYLKLKKKMGYVAGDGKTFYAWKHTGVVAYWKVLKDPYAIMRQCRHRDLKTTLIYLKSLGLNPNFQFRDANVVL